ncbi:oligopeptide/dipeptide ABC transporter ATP-binding protein [Thermoproteota archaeon]
MLDTAYQRHRTRKTGEIPIPIDLPPGCRFYSRCIYSKNICKKDEPELEKIDKNYFVACHRVDNMAI